MKFMSSDKIASDGTPRFAASHLGLYCLFMSHKKDTRLIYGFVGHDLGPNCLPRLSADDTGRQKAKLTRWNPEYNFYYCQVLRNDTS